MNTGIYEINLNENNSLALIGSIAFFINEMLYVPLLDKLVLTSASNVLNSIEDFEMYSLDLQNSSLLTKLAENQAIEEDLQLSNDGKRILFLTLSLASSKSQMSNTQGRLYSIDLSNGELQHIGANISANIVGYACQSDENILILGQLGTQVQIYANQSSIHYLGWNGTYESLVTSKKKNFIAFVHSSFDKPMKVYIIDRIDELSVTQSITNHNELFTERNLPHGKVYSWKNRDDNQTIEGILYYLFDKLQSTNRPLLVLCHGGPYYASVNQMNYNGANCAPLAALHGWLVLEPNYRGSTGYGDVFLNEIRHQPLSPPGKDILFGIDSLIQDGIVDFQRLAIAGYSYGGFLTNCSTWGILDMPVLIENLFGGFPWNVPDLYQKESPIYKLGKVRTLTHNITGEMDVRVPPSQSHILERALYYRGVPVELLIFPRESHAFNQNPKHQNKVQRELQWLHKYL
ncbi:unnamed protein product [Adineta ricciae]|uniref:Peptidase S9 prolyl oligopeptidase catalytic domain-containing protein n=1 Tax=Adineta ricciae TaxID=249248 RepID=A0A814A7N1_ADIRI|nr:unnamed protein product [Adineta ricciae]CAF1418601.1 unnamed protein product [Adineta ricciae]